MQHHDHVNLLRDGIPGAGGHWADFGSGRGAFTLALAELIGSQGTIYSVDMDQKALRTQQDAFRRNFAGDASPELRFIHADFTRPLDLPPLEGIVMANSLHFLRHKEPVLILLFKYLKPFGRLLLVEYNLERGNPWVPFPVPFPAWELLAEGVGFTKTTLLKRRPSRTMREIYSALSIK